MRSPALPLVCLSLLAGVGCGPGLETTVTRNPICDISAVVRWNTDDPASSWVEVSQDSGALFRVGSDDLVTEHEVIVVGMTERQAYQLEAVSTTDSGREKRSETHHFATGELPDDWMQGELSIHDTALVQPGWIATNIMTASYGPVIAVILDEEGQVVWYYVHDGEDGGADIEVSWFHDTGELLIGPHMAGGDRPLRMDLKGEISWLGPVQPGDPDSLNIQNGQLHHVLWELDNGDHISVESQYEEVDGDVVQGDRVVQLDAANNELWSWSAFDHIDYDPDDVYLGLWWTHLNSVALDLDEDVAYINSWVHAKTWKVDRATGEILWTLGEGGDFTPDPDSAFPWHELSHSFDPIGDGHYLIYDNGGMGRDWSRVIEYALDEDTMTAEIVWEYPNYPEQDSWYVASCGDIDLMDNGNRLVVAHRRIMELTLENEIVWEYTWIPADDTPDLRSYQAERIPALVEPL